MGRRLLESDKELRGGAGRIRLFPMNPMPLRETAQHCTAFVRVLQTPRPSSWWSERRIPETGRPETRKDTRHLLYRARPLRQVSREGVTKGAVCLLRPRRGRFASRQEKSRSIRALRPAAEV